MNKNGQIGVGLIVIIAIVAILGSILLVAIAQSVGESTNTVSVVNTSLATVVASTAQYLDYRALSDVVIYNETEGVVPAANYTVANNVINPTTGALAVSITPTADTIDPYLSAWKVSGTAQPTTYVAESGGRAMVSLIVVMFALAVAVAVIAPTIGSKMLESLGR